MLPGYRLTLLLMVMAPASGQSADGLAPITEFKSTYNITGLPPSPDNTFIRLDINGLTPHIFGIFGVSEGGVTRLTLRASELKTWAVVNGRGLEGQESRLYLGAEKRIKESIRTAVTPTIDLVLGALQEIEDLPATVQEDVREALRSKIKQVLAEVVKPGDSLVFDLLRNKSPAIRSMATHILLNQNAGAWLEDADLRALLQENLDLLADDTAHVAGILITYALANRFNEVRGAALAIANSDDIETAREVASIIAWNHELLADVAGLRRLFLESNGVLRQEAAIWFCKISAGLFTPDERLAVAAELVRTMGDSSLPPDFRADAIRVARRVRDQPDVLAALLGLLQPKAWFSGVPGPLRLRHSLTAVLSALDYPAPAFQPRIAADLTELKDRLDLLEHQDRPEVERALDELLARLPLDLQQPTAGE